jgi:hypothetical protein
MKFQKQMGKLHFVAHTPPSSGSTTLVIECFCLLNDFFPFMSVLNAVLPIIYFHGIQIIFNIILPPNLGLVTHKINTINTKLSPNI